MVDPSLTQGSPRFLGTEKKIEFAFLFSKADIVQDHAGIVAGLLRQGAKDAGGRFKAVNMKIFAGHNR